MADNDLASKLGFKRILIPIILGLIMVSYLLYNNLSEVRFVKETAGSYIYVGEEQESNINFTNEAVFKAVPLGEGEYKKITYKDSLKEINWTFYSTLWMFVALLMVIARDLGYMYRLRVLTDGQLSWKQCFHSIMLWEFASAVTPSVVGGSGIAMFIINREGISMGKSTAVVMVTALLDELFYILMVPVVLILIGTSELFPVSLEKQIFGISLGTGELFWVGYGFIILLVSIITWGILLKPRACKYLLLNACKLPFLRKWKSKANETGNDIIITSKELKGKPMLFWIKSFGATFFSWTARYWVVNFMLLAFTERNMWFSVGDHLLIYGRQLVMWVIMLMSPTPGGSGVAEFAFSAFLEQFTPIGLAAALAFLWRLLSYYPYLFIGSIVLPRWVRSTTLRIKAEQEEKTQAN